MFLFGNIKITLYLCSRKQITNKYFMIMKTLRIFLGLFFSIACLIVLVLIDIDTVNTVVNFGGLVAYFEKNPFAGAALASITFFNFFFALLAKAGLLIMHDKL